MDVRAREATDGRMAERRVRGEPAVVTRSRSRLRWYWRLLAWFVAIPLAFGMVVLPSVAFGFLTRQDLLDVFVGTGTDRYTHLALVALAWAFVAAVIVHVSIEIGRSRFSRRLATGDTSTAELEGAPVTG
jgi:hypothetical protein